MTVRLPFCRFLAIFIFFTFLPIYLVFMVQFSKNFQLKILKLNFLRLKKRNNGGETAFQQVLGYFNMFYIFPHIFGVFGPIFKNFWDISIKILFSIVISIFYVVIIQNKVSCLLSILDFKKYTLNLLLLIPIHNFCASLLMDVVILVVYYFSVGDIEKFQLW